MKRMVGTYEQGVLHGLQRAYAMIDEQLSDAYGSLVRERDDSVCQALWDLIEAHKRNLMDMEVEE